MRTGTPAIGNAVVPVIVFTLTTVNVLSTVSTMTCCRMVDTTIGSPARKESGVEKLAGALLR
jgi:hypothetical protein